MIDHETLLVFAGNLRRFVRSMTESMQRFGAGWLEMERVWRELEAGDVERAAWRYYRHCRREANRRRAHALHPHDRRARRRR